MPITVSKQEIVRPSPENPRLGLVDLQAFGRWFDEISLLVQEAETKILVANTIIGGSIVLVEGQRFRIIERLVRPVPDLVVQERIGANSWDTIGRLGS